MFRILLFVLIALILPAVLRAVMAILGKAAQSAASPPQRQPDKPAEPARVGELKRDPVCGTFISTATAFQKALSGETYYFCSLACRDAFKG